MAQLKDGFAIDCCSVSMRNGTVLLQRRTYSANIGFFEEGAPSPSSAVAPKRGVNDCARLDFLMGAAPARSADDSHIAWRQMLRNFMASG